MASRVRPFQEDRPIPARPYPELRTWMVVRSGVISVFPTHSGNAPASPDIQPTTWLCPAYIPSTNSLPAPIQPTIVTTTTHIHQLWLTRPPSMRSSSASEDHPQAPVVTQQQQHRVSHMLFFDSVMILTKMLIDYRHSLLITCVCVCEKKPIHIQRKMQQTKVETENLRECLNGVKKDTTNFKTDSAV